MNRRKRGGGGIYHPSMKPLSKIFSHHNYYVYYKNLLIGRNMKESTYTRMIEAESAQLPQFFRITAEGPIRNNIKEELVEFLPQLKKMKVKGKIIACLEEKFGTMAQIFFSAAFVKQKPRLEEYQEWFNSNIQAGFITRLEFSSVVPLAFLDIQPTDSIFSFNKNNIRSCELINDILDTGIFICNEPDAKRAKTDLGTSSKNYCVISYPLENIPELKKFDKVLCNAPSSDDGAVRNMPGVNSLWSADNAVDNHEKQKKYLMHALKILKVGGTCVYSTNSISPFENEAVINSVFKLYEKGKLEIVDCSEMFKEIKRKKGLTEWGLNNISKRSSDLISSISCTDLVENLDRCMRFYPHQINCTGTFVAVIKKVEEIDIKIESPKFDEKWISNLSCVPDGVVQKFIDDYGLSDEVKNIPFIYNRTKKINILFHVNEELGQLFNNDETLEKLRICHIGSRSWSFCETYPDEPAIPTVQTLPDITKQATKRCVTLSVELFNKMLEKSQIAATELAEDVQTYLKEMPTGGLFISIDGYGPFIGALWKEPFIRLIVKKGAVSRAFKSIEMMIAEKEEKKSECQVEKDEESVIDADEEEEEDKND